MNNKERVEPRNVSLYPSDWKVVDDADTFGSGTSAALRMIVRQWDEMRRAQQAARQMSEALARGPLPTPELLCADADMVA